MGIDGLNRAIRDSAPECITLVDIGDLKKGVYGVDVSIYLYPSLYNREGKGKGCHIRTFTEMITNWRKSGHNLVMVFDGNTSDVKAKEKTLDKRREERNRRKQSILDLCAEIEGGTSGGNEGTSDSLSTGSTEAEINQYAHMLLDSGRCKDDQYLSLKEEIKGNVVLDRSDIDDLMELFRLTGTPYLQASGEADHLLADLFKSGAINGVLSEDGDMLTHGVKILIRGLNDPEYRSGNKVHVYDLDLLLQRWGVSQHQFIDICILAGCDYCHDKIKGIACKTAIKAIRKHGNVENFLATLDEDQIPPDFIENYQEAFRIFTSRNDDVTAETAASWRHVNGLGSSGASVGCTGASSSTSESPVFSWLLEKTNYSATTLQSKIDILQRSFQIADIPVPAPVIKRRIRVVLRKDLSGTS